MGMIMVPPVNMIYEDKEFVYYSEGLKRYSVSKVKYGEDRAWDLARKGLNALICENHEVSTQPNTPQPHRSRGRKNKYLSNISKTKQSDNTLNMSSTGKYLFLQDDKERISFYPKTESSFLKPVKKSFINEIHKLPSDMPIHRVLMQRQVNFEMAMMFNPIHDSPKANDVWAKFPHYTIKLLQQMFCFDENDTMVVSPVLIPQEY